MKRMLAATALLCLLTLAAVPAAWAQPPAPGTLAHPDRWMGELFDEEPAAQDQSLARFIFPGSHDAGTFALSLVAACPGCAGSDRFADPVATCEEKLPSGFDAICSDAGSFMALFGQAWGQAQHLTVRQQLEAGARVLDLRFFRATADDATRTAGQLVEGRFYIHHSLAGPELTGIVNDIAAFLAEPGHDKEVLILLFRFTKEGDGSMGADSLGVLFDQVRSKLGPYMAPKKDAACAGDPGCRPSARFGDSTTIRQLLAQGHQVIVSNGDADAADVWPDVSGTDPSFSSGYPTPDDSDHPWVSDQQMFSLVDELSTERDDDPQSEMFRLGVQIGLDDDAKGLIRSVACQLDPGNVSGYCSAVNDDWDAFEGLADLAAYTNPKALAALVRLRRDRVNIVVADHYTPAFTEEAFKLNRGATRVEVRIDGVTELGSLDATSDADFYPVFFYPAVSPRAWDPRSERNIQIQNESVILPHWPGWKAYPNDWSIAHVGFGINDADSGASGDDDQADITQTGPGAPKVQDTAIAIAGCVQNAAQCQSLQTPLFTAGSSSHSASVSYRFGECVWSWLPGQLLDAQSLCGELPPAVTVSDITRAEGDTGTTAFEFLVTLSAPSAGTVTVHYATADGTAIAGSDYVAVPDTVLIFSPGQRQQIVTVLVNGDGDVESNETFSLNLSSPSGATIEDGRGIGTITNDDVYRLSIDSVSHPEGNAGVTPFVFTVALSGASTDTVTVHYSTADGAGSAAVASDYKAIPDTVLTFAPGETQKTVTVLVNGDIAVEGDETFFVNLSNATNATLSLPQGGCSCLGAGTIQNDDVPPSISAPPPQSGNEGASLSLELGKLNDTRPAGPWTITVKWGDATTESYTVTTAGTLLTRSHTYDDNGSYTVTVFVTDADHLSSNTITFIAAIANVKPTAVIGNSGPIAEGGLATVSLTAPSDPSGADTTAGFHYAYSCTNASLAAATYAGSSNHAATTCTFPDNGVFTVRARIIDKDGGATEYTTPVTVNNVVPVITAVGSAIVENGVATVSGTIADPGTLDSFVMTVTWGDGTSSQYLLAAGTASYSVTHQYRDDNPTGTPTDIMPVAVTVVDKDGATGSSASGVTVNNLAPVVGSISLEDEAGASVGGTMLALSGLPIDLEAAFSDAGPLDSHRGSISWGDGTSSAGAVTETGGNGTVRASHVWRRPGRFTVRVTVTDDDTGAGAREVPVVVTDAAGAVCGLAQLIAPLLGDPTLDSETAKALAKLLGEIQGNNDGRAENGACDKFAKGDEVAGMVKLTQAIGTIEQLLAGGTLSATQQAVLQQVETRIVLVGKATYAALVPGCASPRKAAEAAALARLADAATVSGDYVAAIGYLTRAVRLLAPEDHGAH